MSEPGICALLECDKPVERSNQEYCCQQHRQLAYVREKRRQASQEGLLTVWRLPSTRNP